MTAGDQPEQVLAEYIRMYEAQPLTFDNLAEVTTSDVEFRDPFNHVLSRDGYREVLDEFIDHVEGARFKIHHSAWSGSTAFLQWTFSGKVSRLGQQSFDGVSQLQFNADGLIRSHVDYWDAGEQVYMKVPVVGRMVKKIRDRIGTRDA